MTESEAVEKLIAYYNCQRLQAKGNYDDYDYCPNCGQKIDWSDEK